MLLVTFANPYVLGHAAPEMLLPAVHEIRVCVRSACLVWLDSDKPHASPSCLPPPSPYLLISNILTSSHLGRGGSSLLCTRRDTSTALHHVSRRCQHTLILPLTPASRIQSTLSLRSPLPLLD